MFRDYGWGRVHGSNLKLVLSKHIKSPRARPRRGSSRRSGGRMRRARRGMVRRAGGLFERTAVLEISGDAGRAERVIADLGGDAR